MHAQIVADTLGIPYEQVEVSAADTGDVPDSGPTVASRTCMVVGRILQRCAEEMRARLGRADAGRVLRRSTARSSSPSSTRSPTGIEWDDDDVSRRRLRQLRLGLRRRRGRSRSRHLAGDAGARSRRCTRSAGRFIRCWRAGQIEGGSAQGLGYALLEEVVMRDGRMANAQLTNYIIPTTLDTPPIDVMILENPYTHGPFGAKGVGEMPIDGPAPAVINALRHAGVDVREIPATPETDHGRRAMQARHG